MSLQKFVSPLRIKLHSSRILGSFIIASHCGALVLSLVSAPLWAGILISAGIIYSLVNSLKRHGLLGDQTAISDLVWDDNNEWLVTTRGGEEQHAQLLLPVYLHTRIVILNFRIHNRRRPLVILPDVLDRESFRKLRVRLQLEQYRLDN